MFVFRDRGAGRGFGALVSVVGQTTVCVVGKMPWAWPSWEKAVFVVVFVKRTNVIVFVVRFLRTATGR